MYASAVTAFTHWYTYDLDLRALTLKTFSAIPAHIMNIFGKFQWNASTKWSDLVTRETC